MMLVVVTYLKSGFQSFNYVVNWTKKCQVRESDMCFFCNMHCIVILINDMQIMVISVISETE